MKQFFSRKSGLLFMLMILSTSLYSIDAGSTAAQLAPSAPFDLEWSPDGAKIAGVGSYLIRVWDAANGGLLVDAAMNYPVTPWGYYIVTDVAWSPDSQRFATVAEDAFLRVWTDLGQQIAQVSLPYSEYGSLELLDWSQDGQRIVVGGSPIFYETDTTIIDASSYQILYRDSMSGTTEIAWLPSAGNNRVVKLNLFSTVDVVDLTTGTFVPVGITGVPALAFAINSSGSEIAIGYADGKIIVWDIASTDQVFEMQTGLLPYQLSYLAWSRNDDLLASVAGSSIQVWDGQTGQFLERIWDYSDSIAFSPIDDRLAYVTYPEVARFATVRFLNAAVTLQARPAAAQPFVMAWSQPGTPTLTASVTADGASSLIFDAGAIPFGEYQVWLKHPQHLAVLQPLTFDTALERASFGGLQGMRTGDANDSNGVTITDFSILAAAYGYSLGAPQFDPRADFNGNNQVNSGDYSLLASNFGQSGAARPGGGGALRAAAILSGNAALSLIAPRRALRAGETFEVRVQIDSAGEPIDAAALALNFDPARLQVESVTVGESFPLILANQYDNARGMIDLAVGSFTPVPDTRIIAATLRFRALASASETVIDFAASDGLRENNLTAAGTAVLGRLTSARLRVR